MRGGRGYETAASLKARGEKPVPVEQVMRDMRVNRIFEGSSEIMHLLIAREAVDTHLQAAGDLLMPGGDAKTKADAALNAGIVLLQVVPAAGCRQGPEPSLLRRVRRARPLPALRRALLAQAGALDLLRHGRWQAKLEQKQSFLGRDRRHRRRAVRDRRSRRYAGTIGSEHPERKAEAVELAELFCQQAKRRAETLFDELWSNDDDANYAAAQRVLAGRYTWLEEGVIDPSGDGLMMPRWSRTRAGSRTRGDHRLGRRDRSRPGPSRGRTGGRGGSVGIDAAQTRLVARLGNSHPISETHH